MSTAVQKINRKYAACLVLLISASGCISDQQSLMVVNNIIPDSDNNCEVEVSMSSGSGQVTLNKDVAPVGAWDVAIRDNYWMCPEILNLLKETRDVTNLKGESNMVTISSYEVRYDWGPDLRSEIGSESNFVTDYPRTQGFRDLVTLTIPPGGRYVQCIPVVPEDVGGILRKLDFWNAMPAGFRTYFIVTLKFYGKTSGGRDIETSKFSYRVQVGQGWAFYVPTEKDCCDSEPSQEPCFWGQDHPPAVEVDCRLARGVFDAIYPPDQTVMNDKDEVIGTNRSRCCPAWPDLCDKLKTKE
ncbi:MAG: hypothetical protein GXP49_00270 [Deltaproteobacteria bacterium]|nr:hypothetical protein [Deltaproteobacteria bacterium]